MYDSTIPDDMKISVITPLFKKIKPDDINNYRPIALLSQFSKILEKIISYRFLHFIDKHNLLYAKQYGFIRNIYIYIHIYIYIYIYIHYISLKRKGSLHDIFNISIPSNNCESQFYGLLIIFILIRF